MWVVDKDAYTSFVNPHMAEMLGYTAEEMEGKHLFSFMDDRGVEICKQQLARRAQGIKEQHEFEFLRRNGTRLYASLQTAPITDDEGNYAGSIAGVVDITERKRAEEALRAAEQLSRTTISAIDEGIHVVDPRLRIILFNDTFVRWCKELGLESNVIGRTVSEAFAFLPERVSDDYRQVFDTGRSVVTEETTAIAGRDIITETHKLPVLAGGQVTHVVTVVRDITEQRRLERDILGISDREQQRIGQDLHDGLCQHLRGVALMSEMLEGKLRTREVPETGDAARITQLITEAVTQARRLVTGLSPVSPAPNGLMSALEELAIATEDLFGMPCAFTCAKPVLVDDAAIANHLYRIAQEAVNNAVKHSGGQRASIVLTEHDGTIELTVQDDGTGLASGAEQQHGMGLRIMAFRARMIDASLEISRGHERGTIVTCSVSVPTSESPGR